MVWSPSARIILCLMVFWGQIQNYMMRVNLSILIVAMVKTGSPNKTTSDEDLTCLANRKNNFENGTLIEENADQGLDWDEKTRGLVLGAFSIGYLSTQIIGGRMAEYYGFKKIYGFGILLSAVMCFLSPIVAKWNVWGYMVLRGLQGVFTGVTFPSLYAMTARWVPLKERNSFIARSYFGTVFGLIITFPMCGILIDSFGWESAFYVIGSITCIWFVFWWFLVFDTPELHPRIAKQELDYIKNELLNTLSEKPKPIPWKSILTSIPLWGMIITDMGNCVGIMTLGSYGPSYLKYMLGVDIKTNGFLSGLPMLTRYLGGLFHAAIADYLFTKRDWSVLWVRRVFNSICMCGPAIAMAFLAFPPMGFLQCDIIFTITLLCLGMFFNGAISSGHFSSPVDLSPNYSGTLFGISNTLSGGFMGYTVPVIVGIITQENMTWTAWTIIFGGAATVYIITNFFYFFMISGEIQSWNYYEEEKDKSKEEEEGQSFLNKEPAVEDKDVVVPEETTTFKVQ